MPGSPCILEVSNEFLLLRVNRNHGPSACLEPANLVVDEAELRIAIRVVRPLTRLTIRLQAVPGKVQEFRDKLVANRMPHCPQLTSEIAHTLARPPKRRLGVSRGSRLDESFKVSEQGQILIECRLPTATATPNAIRLSDLPRVELSQATFDGRKRNPRRTRYGSNPAVPKSSRFCGGPYPPSTLVQRGSKDFELRFDMTDIINHASCIGMIPETVQLFSDNA
jgi:hypothetical protein